MVRRQPLLPPHAEWDAREDGCGQWVLVDEDGREPLRDQDPYARMRAVQLASAAPDLLAVLRALLPRLEYLGLDRRHKCYRHLMDAGWAAIQQANGPPSQLARVLKRAGVLELPFDSEKGEDAA